MSLTTGKMLTLTSKPTTIKQKKNHKKNPFLFFFAFGTFLPVSCLRVVCVLSACCLRVVCVLSVRCLCVTI